MYSSQHDKEELRKLGWPTALTVLAGLALFCGTLLMVGVAAVSPRTLRPDPAPPAVTEGDPLDPLNVAQP